MHNVGAVLPEQPVERDEARDLEAASARAETRSARVLALTGVPSIAEAAALAAAGPAARLILPRIKLGPATCALAVAGERS